MVANWLQVPLIFFLAFFFFYIGKVKLGGATLPRYQGASLFGHCCTL